MSKVENLYAYKSAGAVDYSLDNTAYYRKNIRMQTFFYADRCEPRWERTTYPVSVGALGVIVRTDKLFWVTRFYL